ncbi:hypothetical protein DL766_002101 [Monosporascus sp. MC13-8B]|uniref:Nephrocystin 3-like N-terminal domain-containing protein n=1 Tax=Monosporascus cannonballus TaxID=155416 RepID=A0ABY0H181_9PEZI|nr:hypothetical protein DL762_006869 [Monosporascus cannonballus]RYO85443.1 hypothetical protein DL763_007079 [Monosporascus cannonballus]RYP36214.1 hypothetical protein DL766_002101 [Monosporascus sp. MC13-8B]
MADPVSLGASIVAFIEITDRIIRACKYCVETIKDAPKDMQMIMGEAISLRAILDSLGAAELHPKSMQLVPGLFGRGGPVEAIRNALSELENLLPKEIRGLSTNNSHRKFLTELAWPLKESKARKLLAEISHHKSTLLLAATGDIIHDIKDIRSGVRRLDYTITGRDESAPFLRWIIGQLCRQSQWVPRQLKQLYDEGCEPSVPELENALEAMLSRFGTFYVVIDAVDESEPRGDLVSVIATLAIDKRFNNLKILASSRQYFDIERVFSGISVPLPMANAAVAEDISTFVHSRLASSCRLGRWRHLFPLIEDSLVQGAQGMFRWAECQIRAIERLRNETQILAALRNLPEDLAETYHRIFESIPEIDRPFVRRVLLWVWGHEIALWLNNRGINAVLLLQAVAYDLRQADPDIDMSTYNLEDLEDLCSCLITISPNVKDYEHRTSDDTSISTAHEDNFQGTKGTPSTSSTDLFVRLAHYTVAEYLSSPLILQTPIAFFALPTESVVSEFALSVMRQALGVDPMGIATDWVYDREAYCLTLGCTLDWTLFADNPEIQEMFIRYVHPESPHYCRFWAIQKRILLANDLSSSYLLQYLVARNLGDPALRSLHNDAIALMNILRLHQYELAKRLVERRKGSELLEAKLRVALFNRETRTEDTHEGNIFELDNGFIHWERFTIFTSISPPRPLVSAIK